MRFPSSEDGARGMLRGLVGGGRDYINTGPRLSADTGLGACVDAEGMWVCAGGAEELLKRSIPCGIDPRERVLLWMERGREGHWMSHAV